MESEVHVVGGGRQEEAFEEIVRKYSRLVYSAAYRRLNDAHLAEDVTQSVFITLHRKLPGLSPNVSMGGWLIRATQFVSGRVAKAEARRLANETRAMEHFEIAASETDSVETILPLLGEALVSLKPREERCVTARFIDDASFREIAQRENISEDAAQKRCARALEKMRGYLTRRGLKIAAAGALPAFLSESARAADPTLVAGVMHSIASPATTSLALATKAAAVLLWKQRLLLAAKIVTLVFAIGASSGVVYINHKPSIPAAPPMPVPTPRITRLAHEWSGVVRTVAAEIVKPRGRQFRAAFNKISDDTVRLATDVNLALPQGGELMAEAQFLTRELDENLSLNRQQEAAVYKTISDALTTAPSLKDGLNWLYQNRNAYAIQIWELFSIRQQWLFEKTYRRDGLGLFSFCPTLATAR